MELIKFTPDYDSDKNDLRNALTKIETTATAINNKMKENFYLVIIMIISILNV